MDQPEAPLPPSPAPLPPPDRRAAIVLVSLVAGGLDALWVKSSGRSWPGALLAGAVLAVAVAVWLLWVRRRMIRRRAVESAGSAAAGAGTAPPVAGGWANPTTAQRGASRARRALSWSGHRENPLASGPRRRPRKF